MQRANQLIEENLDWHSWVTPRKLTNKSIHRWYIFPHSFTSELVHELISDWKLGPYDRILDPFVGAGTSVLAAREKGVPASGYDISPLAVLVSRVKIARYKASSIKKGWTILKGSLNPSKWNGASKDYPDLITKALPGRLIGAFDFIAREISILPNSEKEKDFFRLALFSIIPKYSRAVATGGWLKWVDKRTDIRSIPRVFNEQVSMMVEDLNQSSLPDGNNWVVNQADSRTLPDEDSTFSAVITSPPYPNRHDYTRVFGVELMFGLLSWEQTRAIRYQSFHSHPEANPQRPQTQNYKTPQKLSKCLKALRTTGGDPRIPLMLEGYFLDMYLSLKEVQRVCRKEARIAYVLGNARYSGIPIPVDEIAAEIGEKVGLSCDKLVVARYRGNSAQQMGNFGRMPSRETVIFFKKHN